MKVDIIEDCKFSPNGISVKRCKAGEVEMEIADDMALSLIDSGFAKEHNPTKKAISEAPENKMLGNAPENKSQKQKPKTKVGLAGKSKAKKARNK